MLINELKESIIILKQILNKYKLKAKKKCKIKKGDYLKKLNNYYSPINTSNIKEYNNYNKYELY